MAFEVEEPALYLKTILYDETQYRLGYRKFYELCWNFEEETKEQVEPPNFGRLENESDASWTKRAEGEQTKFIGVLKSKHDRRDGDTKKKTLQRLVYGRNALTHVLADPGSSVNWEAEPLASESFKSFEQRCYEQYIALVKGIIDSEAYDNAPANPYDPAHHSAILLLDGLKSSGRHGEYYARNIRESLAKAWANGEHRATYRHLAAGEKFTSWEKRQNMFGGTGVTIQGGLDDFEGCFNIYKELPEQLTSSLNEAEAKIFADNYKPVCPLYDSVARRMLTSRW
jgi:hypothetical protein